MTTRFDSAIALTRTDEDTFEASIDSGFSTPISVNGGYLAAILQSAMEQVCADAERPPRSLTVHFTERAEVGPATIVVERLRTGKSLTSLQARMRQGSRTIAVALGAFSRSRPGPSFCDLTMPDVKPPHAYPPPRLPAQVPSMVERFEARRAIGAGLFAASAEALSGGWIRLAEPRPMDNPLIVLLSDAWAPAVFTRLKPEDGSPGIPTIDLTVHFRSPIPPPDAESGGWVLSVFRTRMLRDGFLEEDGEIWSRDGVLIAQCRQLAVLLARTK
jgi:acyl-CoA thioesterase